MASITANGNGYLIQFYLNRRRKTISFKRNYSRSEVEEIARNIQRCLVAMELETSPDKKTLQWLASAPVELKDKLSRAGIIEIEKRLTLGELFDAYFASAEYRALKPKTQDEKRITIKRFFVFFKRETWAENISKTNAREFVEYLTPLYSEATKAGTVRDVARVFNWAIESELLDKNPFARIARGSFKNKTGEYYITMEEYERILAACNDQTSRALFALYRIGGLRKTEATLLTWQDVDFEAGTLRVHSPKTERHRGRDSRLIPLYPRLKEELIALRQEGNGDSRVIPLEPTSVFTKLKKIVLRSGVPRWQRLVQNLRSSRAIEIYREFGAIAETEWIGHSERTAADHYLHILADDFKRATRGC